ncbi:hypothetical protein [Devosia salina]|uniref:Uncharacterized protein n=1 Tax=Devosia salina TaxID=2860336 RepID=A0ABX8WJV3_9HYPH|nr:hypothetical protein [Devosia salina]QYO78618.1 hypothetical protein K1X15_08810 [Devosia salina]
MASPVPSESAAIAIGPDRLGQTDIRVLSGNPRLSLPKGRPRLRGVGEALLRTLK